LLAGKARRSEIIKGLWLNWDFDKKTWTELEFNERTLDELGTRTELKTGIWLNWNLGFNACWAYISLSS